MIRAFTVSAVLCLISRASYAQFIKDQKLLVGNISLSTNSGDLAQNGFNNDNINHTSNTVITVNVSAAKFINANTLWAKTHNNSFYIATSLSNTSLGNVGLGFRWLLKRKVMHSANY